MFKKIILATLPLFSGCDFEAMKNEAASKTEYSVLEHYEYIYRDVSHEKSYIITENALNTGLNVIAFPIKNRSTGYVVVLARTEGKPKVKVMDKYDFSINPETFDAIRREVKLSKEVDQFIAAQVQ